MAGGLLTRKAVVAVEAESVEGTAETLVAADGTMLAYEPRFTPGIEVFERNPARQYLGQLAGVRGRRAGTVSWRTEMKGSGSVTTKPAWHDAIMACGFGVTTVQTQAIGTISGGPFYPGETVKNSGRTATGRVVGEIDATPLYYVPTSGTIGNDVEITGLTSAATCQTTGAVADDKGWEYLPDSSSPPSATVGLQMDGTMHTIYGSRGNVRIETGEVGEPVFLAFEFQGVYEGTVDTTLFSPSYEATVPPAFLNTDATILGYSAPIFATANLDMQNTVAARMSASAVRGILSYLITDRNPMVTMDPELELVATHDFYGSLATGTTGRSFFEIGATAGNHIFVGLPRTEYRGLGEGDREGIATVEAELACISGSVTTGDDEVQIAMV